MDRRSPGPQKPGLQKLETLEPACTVQMGVADKHQEVEVWDSQGADAYCEFSCIGRGCPLRGNQPAKVGSVELASSSCCVHPCPETGSWCHQTTESKPVCLVSGSLALTLTVLRFN